MSPYAVTTEIRDLLLRKNLLTEQLITEAIDVSRKNQLNIISVLIEKYGLSATELLNIFSSEYGIPIYDIQQLEIKDIVEQYHNHTLIEKHHCLPIYVEGERLFIAMSDPTNITALEEFQFNAGMHTEPLLVDHLKLTELIESILEDDINALDIAGIDDAALAEMEVTDTERNTDDQESNGDDAPIVSYINKILTDAIRKGASDLHFEPYEKNYRVRFRIDGILHEMGSPPAYLAGRLAARLKVMSKMDIAEKRIPQDGRIKLKLSAKKSIDFRVSSLPTLFGEKIVLRILDSSIAMMGIESLGYEPEQQKLFQDTLQQPQGMILVTGPTGSGKTVSLYTGLNILNTPERNISTAEDPVEINLSGVNQVHINNKAGLDFSSALRAFLRQDPDVVMVGEIRDLETAEIAIKAAQTGHLVLSTLHTNSAAETITRLINMGVPGYNIASSVSLIIAQRLARRLCEHCKKPESLPAEELIKLGFSSAQIADSPQFYQPQGCDKCSGGYKGRVGIYEVMPLTETIGRVIMEGGNSLQIADIATQEGVNNLRKSGLLKAISGVTSLAEINRVTSF